MDIKYYDIGVNLFCKQFPHPEQVIQEAEEAGVCCILTGTDPEENEKIHEFVKSHPVYGTAGLHPHNADEAKEADYLQIERIITENKRIVAVGECGLDFDRMFSTRENQIACLKRHILLAEKLDMPLFLHEREASGDFIKCLEGHPEICRKSVVHCFTGNRQTLEQYLSMGFFIGVTGWICDDRRAAELRDAVSLIPPDRILIETDAPYLTPRNIKGLARTNVPQNITYVAAELARYMGISEEALVLHARENTKRLFRLD